MVKNIFAECISRHGYNILAFETNRDHVHMLAEVKNKEEVANMVRTLKAVSARQILQAEACREKRAFWARRYGCKKILPENVTKLTGYIVDQKKIPHASAWGMEKLTAE